LQIPALNGDREHTKFLFSFNPFCYYFPMT
jgi:hypothetical protein